MTLLTAKQLDYRTVRRLLARVLKVPEAMNTKQQGLYAYNYGSYIMVRLYRAKSGVNEKIYEARVLPSEFPTEHMVAQLMLIA